MSPQEIWELANDPKTPLAVSLQGYIYLVNLYLGPPIQVVKVTTEDASPIVPEIWRVDGNRDSATTT